MQDRVRHSRINVLAVLPSSTRNGVGVLFQTGFSKLNSRPTDTSVYASSGSSRRRLQDSRPGWIRCLLSCRALSSPTTCRFIPALSGLPVIQEESQLEIRVSQRFVARFSI